MKDRLISEQYEGIDGGAMGCEEIASAWLEMWERPDGSRYLKRVLRDEFYSPNSQQHPRTQQGEIHRPKLQPLTLRKR